jgi:hypothetical protein
MKISKGLGINVTDALRVVPLGEFGRRKQGLVPVDRRYIVSSR